jgi:hypothetical protein
MDRTKKTQIGLMMLGLFVAGLGIYLTFSSVTYLITSVVTISGIAIVRYGFRYKPRDKQVKTTIEKSKPATRSANDNVALTGLVIFFVSLSVAFVGMLAKSSLIVGISLLFIFVGIVVLIIGRDLRNFEKNKKYEMQKTSL